MQAYSDKEILADGLSAQKACAGLFNTAANECMHDSLRSSMLNILADEHKIQAAVFDMMHQRGFYETPAADAKKVEKAKQKFSQTCQPV